MCRCTEFTVLSSIYPCQPTRHVEDCDLQEMDRRYLNSRKVDLSAYMTVTVYLSWWFKSLHLAESFAISATKLSALLYFRLFAADVFGWPKPQCMLPAWTTRSIWRDITGRHVYTTNDMGDTMDVGYRSSPTSSVEISTSVRCFRILARNTTANHVTVIAFIVRGCTAKYQCISFVKRKDSVIELHKGRPSRLRSQISLFFHIYTIDTFKNIRLQQSVYSVY